jgi:hypothetical protein
MKKILRILDRLDDISIWKLFILAALFGWALAAFEGLFHDFLGFAQWLLWKR